MRVTRRAAARTFASLLVPAVGWGDGTEIRCDVAVIGGGTGGVAAALAALRQGMRVVLTEETSWIGGQLTSQAVPPDEHPWIESFGCTRSYRAYREAVRSYYRRHYVLTQEARENLQLNPGGGSVSRLTHEPKVSVAVLEAMLARWVSGGQLVLMRGAKPVAAVVSGDRVKAVKVRLRESGAERTIVADWFIDATEMGDLLPMTGTEFVTGFESKKQTGEERAPEVQQAGNHQAFTVCFALGYEEGADHTIDKPANYAFWRDYVPALRPAWPGKLFSLVMTHPITLQPRPILMDPSGDLNPPGQLNLWIYRRIVRKAHHTPGECRSDVTLVNWPQNDYFPGNLYGGTPEENARHLEGGRELSRCLVYWLQTEAPRPDGGQGWKGLHLRPDITGTNDGLAMYPYIRESRRILAEFTVLSRMVSADGDGKGQTTAVPFPDSVGVGSYRLDLHPSTGGDNYIDMSTLPFQIPLGALIPQRMENLLPGSKNLGVTHLTNGCYRLHPVEWNIGEAVGALAGHCQRLKLAPRQVRRDAKLLKDFQGSLTSQGVEIAWPRLFAV